MMNQDNPYAMNQTCKVCGEPAAGFHFGAFTCEGCKSFFGRSYNNLSSISDCKNNGECIINKKNRTACKACRLRKCLMVGMSKSGSRYGRRSNWFKIHCLLQEQHQQAAALAAQHNSQQQQQNATQVGHGQSMAQKGMLSVPQPPPPSAAAAAAFGMLGHAGAYPGLYQPRIKEEMMMLGLEEYAKHPAASPSVSSPDSHNSDSSLEVNVRSNALLKLANNVGSNSSNNSGKEANSSSMNNVGGTGVVPPPPPPQIRKDLPPFLPLPFPGFPVMAPPGFVPPSHLLFSGYHPVLYQHHQGLLKPSPEAAVAAAAVQHLFNATVPNRFTPPVSAATASLVAGQNSSELSAFNKANEIDRSNSHDYSYSKHNNNNNINNINNNNNNNNNNNDNNNSNIENSINTNASTKILQTNTNDELGASTATSDDFTKRFYLDAVLKSQRKSPPPTTTKLPMGHSKHDYSISALVTPNSESSRDRLKSRRSNAGEDDEDCESTGVQSQANDSDDCGEDLVVSMTPPRSPALPITRSDGQDIPIDLSMKANSSITSSVSSKCSSNGFINPIDDLDSENVCEVPSHTTEVKVDIENHKAFSSTETTDMLEPNGPQDPKETSNHLTNPVTISLDSKSNDRFPSNYDNINTVINNNNNVCNIKNSNSSDSNDISVPKRKSENESPSASSSSFEVSGTVKRIKIQMETIDKTKTGPVPAGSTTPIPIPNPTPNSTTTTIPLDLSAKV